MKLRVTVALFAFAMLSTSLASAQLSDAEKKAGARAAFKEGVTYQDSGKPGDALVQFEKAQALYDAPTHLLHIAECQALTGKLVEAVETYTKLVNKSLDKDAPDAFVQAQAQAKAELSALQPRVPTMRILVKPEPRSLQNLQITVNDRQLPGEIVDVARPVNPGAYRLSASANGWGTPTPAQVEVREKDASVVTLTLQKGAVAAVVVTPPQADTSSTTPPPVTSAPAEYDQGVKSKPAPSGPSSAGLLLGAHLQYVAPLGAVKDGTTFKERASGGPGFGIDLVGRVARLLLIGGTLDIAPLGAPSKTEGLVPSGSTGKFTTTSVYAGLLVGVLPNVDKVSFYGDLGFGMRWLSYSLETQGGTVSKQSEDYNGWELGLNAGLSIPLGPIRAVPKVGIAFGNFTTSTPCVGAACNQQDITGDSAGHTILTAGLTLYYNLDLAKKPKAASSSSAVFTAVR